MVISAVFGGILPYASSYNAHTVNHAIATPLIQAAPLVAAAPAPAFITRHALASGPAVFPSYSAGTPFAALSAPLVSPVAPSLALNPYNINTYPYVL